MALTNVLQQVLDVGVLLLAEVAVPFNFLMHPFDVYFKMTFAETLE